MGIRKVKLERAGETSAVDSSDFVCLFIRFIIFLVLDSCPRVAHNTLKLQTVVMHDAACHYHARLESDQLIHIPLLRVYSFLLSASLRAIAS